MMTMKKIFKILDALEFGDFDVYVNEVSDSEIDLGFLDWTDAVDQLVLFLATRASRQYMGIDYGTPYEIIFVVDSMKIRITVEDMTPFEDGGF